MKSILRRCPLSSEIKNAKGIEIVWNEFVSYIDENIGKDQRGFLLLGTATAAI